MTISYPAWPIGLAAIGTYVTATYTGKALSLAGMVAPPRHGRFGCVDGLRGYLALSVMIFHCIVWMMLVRSAQNWVPPTVNLYSNFGPGSVGIFFMITGFLFYPRILAGFRKTAWPATYIGRFFRIVPMTLLSVLLVTMIAFGRMGTWPDRAYIPAAAEWLTGWKEPPLLGYTGAARTNCYVLWTLWYEWIFYIVALPLCALASDAMRNRAPSWLLPMGLLAGALVARHTRGLGGWPTFVPLFAVGMLAFECQQHARLRTWMAARIMALPALASLALGMWRQPNPYGELQLPLFGFFFLAVASGNDFGGVLTTRGARLLGECSFGIYLMHALLLSIIFVEGAPWMAGLPLGALPIVLPPAAIVVVCLCALLHVTIEKPAMRAGRSIVKSLSPKRVLEGGGYVEPKFDLPTLP